MQLALHTLFIGLQLKLRCQCQGLLLGSQLQCALQFAELIFTGQLHHQAAHRQLLREPGQRPGQLPKIGQLPVRLGLALRQLLRRLPDQMQFVDQQSLDPRPIAPGRLQANTIQAKTQAALLGYLHPAGLVQPQRAISPAQLLPVQLFEPGGRQGALQPLAGQHGGEQQYH